MTDAIASPPSSQHRVGKPWRWFSAVAVPPMLGLMVWAAREMLLESAAGDASRQLWAAIFALTLFGGVSLALIAALIWAFRARVIIAGDRMIVRGAFLESVIEAADLDGFRYMNGQLHAYLKSRRFALQLAYFERQWQIDNWIRQRTNDIDQELLDDEDQEISNDIELGITEEEKSRQLQSLRRNVRWINAATYAAGAIGFVNFLFFENNVAHQIIVAILVGTPLILDTFALSNRGRIRIDCDEGSRYPEIFSGTFASGIMLALIAVLERGALLNDGMYAPVIVAVVAKGLLWCAIDRDRLIALRKRGGNVVMMMTVAVFFLIPAFWVGGSVYMVNQQLDQSDAVVHSSVILDKGKSSGKATSFFSVDLAPWSPALVGPVSVTVRRAEFNELEVGMPVFVTVRDGALGVPWVSDLQPAPVSNEDN